MPAADRLWTIVRKSPNESGLTLLTLGAWNTLRLVNGQSRANVPLVKFRSESSETPQDVLWHANARLVSKRVKERLAKFSSSRMGFYSVQINWKGEDMEYWIWNVLSKCDCVNFAKSDLDLLNGTAVRIHRLRIRDGFEADVPIFLLAKVAVLVIAMKGEVVEALRKINCSGVEFVELDSFES